MDKKATLRLPNGIDIDLEEFDSTTLGRMIELAQENFDDPEIATESFDVGKYSIFVNTTRASMMEANLKFSRTLSTLMNDRDLIELRLLDPPEGPDGHRPNPMFGVKFFTT